MNMDYLLDNIILCANVEFLACNNVIVYIPDLLFVLRRCMLKHFWGEVLCLCNYLPNDSDGKESLHIYP